VSTVSLLLNVSSPNGPWGTVKLNVALYVFTPDAAVVVLVVEVVVVSPTPKEVLLEVWVVVGPEEVADEPPDVTR
jgi:hypothetical protein